MNLNKIMLAGNLTRDPELRATPAGKSVVKFGLALNRSFSTEGGEKKDETTFVDVEAWGKTAEIIGQHFVKGKAIFVEGRLRLDQWEDKTTGEKRSRLIAVCESFQFVGGKEKTGESEDQPPKRQRPPATIPRQPSYDEDVPF